MKIFRFYKVGYSQSAEWYVDLPDYLEQGGSEEELQMVAGADVMLELLAHGDNSVLLALDLLPFEGSMTLGQVDEDGNYLFHGDPPFPVWLCPVTKYIFGDYPPLIHIKKISNHEFKALNTCFVSGVFDNNRTGEEESPSSSGDNTDPQ